MGQYLTIGIATSIRAYLKRQDFRLTIEEMRNSLEKQFNQTGIYNVMEYEDAGVRLTLKPEVAEPDWIPMIKDFYDLRYNEGNRYGADLKVLMNMTKLEEWIELSDKKMYQGYQTVDQYYYGYKDEINGWNRYIETQQEIIALSLDGKIIMECYNDVLEFFTKLIREKLGKYRLADAMVVEICG